MTKSETDRADAIAAKIAKAEKMDVKCNPLELAIAKTTLDHAIHEGKEGYLDQVEEKKAYFDAAEKAADPLGPGRAVPGENGAPSESHARADRTSSAGTALPAP